ncbi:hypothetical protein TNCV_3042821 [Trichonephila clavipes]|nr:hypothetical protein TNCV_3042821 [Trichonephila clavipes]
MLAAHPEQWLVNLVVGPLGLDSNPREGLNVCKCHLIPSATLRRFINSKASRRSCIIMPPKRRAIGRSTPQARREEHYEPQNQTSNEH